MVTSCVNTREVGVWGSLVAMSAENQGNDMTASDAAQREDAATEQGQRLLVALVVLALLASIVMLFTGSVGVLKLALLAALWAAIIGLFLVSRYRVQASRSQAALESEKALGEARLHEAEQRFAADKAQLKVDLEKQLRENEEETLKAIRSQLEDLRAQLEYLTGQSLAEPGMLRAQARRIMEIETATDKAETTVIPKVDLDSETTIIDKVVAPEPPRRSSEVREPAKATAQREEPVEEKHAEHRSDEKKEEGKLSVSQLAATAASKSPYIGGKRRKPEAKPEFEGTHEAEEQTDSTQEKAAPRFDTGSMPKLDWVQGGVHKDTDSSLSADNEGNEANEGEEPSKEQPSPSVSAPASNDDAAKDVKASSTKPKAQPLSEPEGSGEESPVTPASEKPAADQKEDAAEDVAASHGRRRRDEHSGAVSVADLLKRSRKDS
ncbi:putative secreted protein [Corynebacterium vitaeruminis DSM 20294]|uniref:Putative secreted protein n=2 Tax=Corynebacterium vitaeruminis TaxID=38305 RepID=W5Y423_9CORY|nr:putative secreted protein [Corynebacterium vitaeruminis DSM 20294]